jgi:ATP-dependent protease HslVU (ClpYQ) peptidase subunit
VSRWQGLTRSNLWQLLLTRIAITARATITKALPSLRKCLVENGYNFDESKTETRFQFLIAVCGEIFDVDHELSVSKNESGIYAAGSGAPYALGALHAGADAYEAMEIAAKLTAFTSGPYITKIQYSK